MAICTPHHRETIYDRKLFVDLENCGYKRLRLLSGYMVLYSIYIKCVIRISDVMEPTRFRYGAGRLVSIDGQRKW